MAAPEELFGLFLNALFTWLPVDNRTAVMQAKVVVGPMSIVFRRLYLKVGFEPAHSLIFDHYLPPFLVFRVSDAQE